MPKIIIREYDNTKAGSKEYDNFAVVIPGFVAEGKGDCFDENGIYKCTKQADFVDKIGKVPAVEAEAVAAIIDNGPAAYTDVEFATYQPYVYTVVPNPTGTVGYLKTADYICIHCTKYVAGLQYCVINPHHVGSDAKYVHYGNQMAYRLLELGYTVLYKKLETLADFNADNFAALKDRSAYDFRYICTGGYCDDAANKVILEVVANLNKEKLEDIELNGRGDCFAILDIDEVGIDKTSQKTIIEGIRSKVNATKAAGETVEKMHDYLHTYGKYAELCCPKVTFKADKQEYFGEDKEYENNCTMPASFYYLACAAHAFKDLNYNPWYAVSGYDRGVCKWPVAGASFKLGEAAINALEPRTLSVQDKEVKNVYHSVNLISYIRENYYLWGNRTAHEIDSEGLVASHFLNIRQLCCSLKKELYNSCKRFTFDPNSDILWANFCNSLKPLLEKMKADQGIGDYRIIKVKDKENRKALLLAKIRIVPIEAVEDFDISVYLEDSLTGIVASADEE